MLLQPFILKAKNHITDRDTWQSLFTRHRPIIPLQAVNVLHDMKNQLINNIDSEYRNDDNRRFSIAATALQTFIQFIEQQIKLECETS